jgi:3-phenylpropionate/trans-cinnamate dioxygenase ferredoxin reductase subunit
VGTETHLPYERPPLSKGYLKGDDERDAFEVHDRAWYDEHDVTLRLGETVTALDLGAGTVTTDAGDLPFDAVVLATGSEPRRLDLPGADLDGVLTLRTVDDSERLRAVFGDGVRVVVVGGGWIGLETAAAAREKGSEVTVVLPEQAPLERVLGTEMGGMFGDLHREHGVELRTGAQVSGFRGDGIVDGVELADGTVLPADVVVLGVGVEPRTGLAEQAGLAVDDGVLVDARLRSSDPRVLAVGDIAAEDHPTLGTRVRVEHWATALNQPAAAAATLLGRDEPYDELPYFFSDQYDLGMEYLGHADPRTDALVVRGDRAGRELIAFWTREGRVTAGMNVNVWDVTDDVKALIRSGAQVDPARLADPDVPLSELARG